MAPEVARALVRRAHPARHPVVVDDGQERLGRIRPAHAGRHQQQAVGHPGGALLDDDVREVGRDAVHGVPDRGVPVADFDHDVVIVVHGDRVLHGAGGRPSVVQQREAVGRILCPRRHAQCRAVRAAHGVVPYVRTEARKQRAAAGNLQGAQARGRGVRVGERNAAARRQQDGERRADREQGTDPVFRDVVHDHSHSFS